MRFRLKLPLPRPDARAILSAAFLVASFPPWGLWWLLWIGMIPWIDLIHRAKSWKEAFFQGVWMSFFISIGAFYWIAHTLHEFGGVPWPLSVLGLCLFSLAGQPIYIVFGAFTRYLGFSRAWYFPLLFALAYAGVDWTVPKLFVDTLGQGFIYSKTLRQLAEIGGPWMLTSLLVLCNLTIYRQWGGRSQRPRLELAIVAALVIAANLFGRARYEKYSKLEANPPQSFQAAVIQGNIGDIEKVSAEKGFEEASKNVLRTMYAMTDSALKLAPKPDVVIWPETSYPSAFRVPRSSRELAQDQELEQFVKTRETPLLFGGYDASEFKEYNAFFLLSPNLELQTYRKNILLMFGEYLPFADQIKWLRDAFPEVGNFGRGKGPDSIRLPLPPRSTVKSVAFSPVICYEALFPSYTAEGARKGAQVILNITNDSWFGADGEPILHLALVAFRSIETRLPQIRSTNTGISTLITPSGEITSQSGLFRPEILNLKVPLLNPEPTLMTRWGDWFPPFALVLGLFGLIAVRKFFTQV